MPGFGIIGLGKMGMAHAGWISGNPEMKLVAVCEKNEARVTELKKQFDVPFYTDADEFMKTDGLDFVVVVTTNEVHELMTVKALEAGKNVIVEKPMSLSFESAQRMVRAAEKAGRQIFVHQSSRWDRDYLLVREAIASGRLGEILCIQSKVMLCDIGWPSWGIEGMSNPWRIKAQYGGGMLFDWGPHLVDQMLQLMGKDPSSVFGMLQKGVWSKEVDDYFFAMLRFESGTVCQIEASNNSMLDMPRWFVIGTKGTLTVKGRHDPVWNEAELACENASGRKEIQRIELLGVCESGMEGGFYQDLLPYLNGEKKEFVLMADAAKVVKVLELIKKSSDENRIIDFF